MRFQPILSFPVVLTVLSSLAGWVPAAVPPPPIDIADRKQLFIDHRFIDASTGIQLTANSPVKKEIVLAPEGLEKNGMFWMSSIVRDRSRYLIYYGTRPSSPSREQKSDRPTLMHVAESTDGIHFNRIPVGLIDPGYGKDNNIIMAGAWGTVFIDPRETDGYPFWMIGHMRPTDLWPESLKTVPADPGTQREEGRAFYLARSRDGINWSVVPEPAFPFTGDTRNQGLFDPRLGKYICYLRCRLAHGNRSVARGENDQLIGPWPFTPDPNPEKRRPEQLHWLMNELPIVMAADEHDPPAFGLYTPNVHIYPWADDAYIAMPDYYRLRDGIPSFGRDQRGKPANEGPLCPGLAVSRDGINWQRFRSPYVPLGQIGQVDGGTIYMGVGMIRNEDEIWQYVSASPHTHHGYGLSLPGMDGGIIRVVQRLDGFVSADAGPQGGEITTPPLLFRGNRLQLNVDASAIGEVWVEIRDPAGQPIPGFTLDEAVSVDMNGTAQEVWWKNGPDVSSLTAQPVRLHFRIRSAKLYAFQFTTIHPQDNQPPP